MGNSGSIPFLTPNFLFGGGNSSSSLSSDIEDFALLLVALLVGYYGLEYVLKEYT
jgi:hypothetical protein